MPIACRREGKEIKENSLVQHYTAKKIFTHSTLLKVVGICKQEAQKQIKESEVTQLESK